MQSISSGQYRPHANNAVRMHHLHSLAGTLLILSAWATPAVACHYDYPVSPDWPQLYRKQVNGRDGGLLPAIFSRVNASTSCTFSPVIVPVARRNAMFNQGKLKILVGVIRNAEPEKSHAQFVSMFHVPLRLAVLDSSPFKTANEVLSSYERRLGLMNGQYLPQSILEKLRDFPAFKQRETSNERSSLYLKLQHQRIHAVLDTSTWLDVDIPGLQAHLRQLAFEPPILLEGGAYLAMDMPASDREKIASSLQQLRHNGTLQRLIMQYLPLAKMDIAPATAHPK